MPTQQLKNWCDDVMAIILSGTTDVDEIIQQCGRMNTLAALKQLELERRILWCGNRVFLPGQNKL